MSVEKLVGKDLNSRPKTLPKLSYASTRNERKWRSPLFAQWRALKERPCGPDDEHPARKSTHQRGKSPEF